MHDPVRFHRATFGLVCILIGLIVAVSVVAISSGVTQVPTEDLFKILLTSEGGDRIDRIVVWQVRMPRIALAIIGGACLGIAGALLQDALRNPLAEPTLLGISSGASLFIACVVVLEISVPVGTLPLFALTGALLSGSVILLVSTVVRDPVRLILTGAAMTALFTASITLVVVLASATEARAFFSWVSGSLIGRGWEDVNILWPWALILLPVSLFSARPLNLLRLGDDVASGLGLSVFKMRTVIFLSAIGLVAPVVATMGPIGFISLIAPHLVRAILGTANAFVVLPLSGLMGAGLLVLADLVAREVLRPSEVPVGLIVTGIGTPVALYFLRKLGKQRR